MRFQSLEAFRGLAAIFIILFHSLFTTSTLSAFRINSHLFVDFFFILSGFIISYAYLEKLGKKEIQAKSFLLKRVFRLYPLHLFILFIWLIYIVIKHEAFLHNLGGQDPYITHALTSFMEHLLLVQTWGAGNIMCWNVPSWSISVEMMAYILFVVFTLSFHNMANRLKVFFSILFIILCKSLLYFYPEDLKDFLFLLNGLSAFFLGVILYIIYSMKKKIAFSVTTTTLVELALLASIYMVLNLHITMLGVIFIQLIFAVTIFFFAIQEYGLVSKLLQKPIFQTLGLLSYSIYMIHALIVEITGHLFEYILKFSSSFQETRKVIITGYADLINLAMIVIVILLAHLTYTYIEQPSRKKLNSKLLGSHENT